MDVPVNKQLKFQQSFETVDGASHPVHRQSAGHFSYGTETGTHSATLCRGP